MPDSKKKDSFILQAGILASAGIIVRIIGLLYNAPLVAIIGDEGNGYYNSAYYAYSIILLISSYSIPSAVSKVIAQKLATREYRNAHRIFRCAFIYVLVVGGIASLFVFFGAGLLVKMESAILPLKVLAPTIFFSGILGVLRGYFQAHKSMAQTSLSQIIEQIVNAGVSIGMAYVMVGLAADKDATTRASFGAAGGTIGTGAGVLAGLLFMLGMYALNKKTIRKRIERDTTHEDESNGEIFKMILMVVTPFILSTGIYNINNFLDNTIYQRIMMDYRKLEEAVVAMDLSVVAKGTKISNIPIAFASAMSSALIPGISSDFARKRMSGVKDKVAKSVKVTMMISIPCAVGIGVLAKPIMTVIFHQPESLEISSVLLTCMAVSIIFYGLSTLAQAILQSIGRMKTPIINATAAVLIHAGIMIGTMMLLDVKYSLYCYVFSTVLYSLILCVLNQCSVHHYLKYRQGVTKTFLIPIFASVIMGAASFGVYQGLYYLCKINIVALAVAVFVGAAVYFTLIIRCGVVSEAELRGMPKGHMLAGIAKKMKILKPEESSKRKSGRKKASKPPEKGKEYSKGKPSVKGEALQRRISGEEMPERRIWASEAERPDETDEDYWLDD
ncbi:MAG: polysaccharide biosynthesis protein [Lachnospiraceae bacterium]|nr:polysaccharide biosynthesis protein [Lachnospiraceae bacterium]